MRNPSVATTEAEQLRAAEIRRKLEAAFGASADESPQDALVVLAERLSPAERYAHVLLAPLTSFDAALFDAVVAPLVQERTGAKASFESVVRDHATRLADYRYRLERSYASSCLSRSNSGALDAPTTAVVLAVLRRIALEWTPEGAAGEWERLRLLAGAAWEEALPRFVQAFEEADHQFDLPRCRLLCDAIRSRPVVDLQADASPLLRALAEREAYLASRSAFATIFYRTGRYYARADVHREILDFLAKGPWALHLHAKGGMGKTAFVQWLIARHCVTWEQRIPVACIDFDYRDAEQRLPERIAFSLASQLDEQLPRTTSDSSGPFSKVLASFRSEVPPDFVAHFCSILRDQPAARPIVLLFDTMEAASQDHEQLGALFDQLRDCSRSLPTLRVLTAGRYSLEQKAPKLWARLSGARELALRAFSRQEAEEYLLEQAGLTAPTIVSAVVQRANDGLPFKLSLLAEIVQAEQLTAEQIAKIEKIDLEYLIVRIIKRLPAELRWVLRYGVIPRQLTREVFDSVILPHVEHAIAGEMSYDQPERNLPERHSGDDVFPRRQRTGLSLWEELLRYESGTSWVSRASGDALVLHADVRAPMQRLLWDQAVTPIIHGELAAFYAYKAEQAGPDREAWAKANAECFYHRFKSEKELSRTAADYVELLRDAAERAPEQARELLGIATSGGSDGEFRPELTRGGAPWLTPEQLGVALLAAAEAALQLLTGNPAKGGRWFRLLVRTATAYARAPEVQRQLALVASQARRLAPVVQGALSEVLTELVRIPSPPPPQPLPPLEAFSAAGGGPGAAAAGVVRNLDDLEIRYHALLRQPRPPWEQDAAWFRSFQDLFASALSGAARSERVTRRIALDFVRELLDSDRPASALAAWEAWLATYPEQAREPEAWLVAAEAALATRAPVPEAPDRVSAELYRCRAALYHDEIDITWSYQPRMHLTDALAVVTEAELRARRFEHERLDQLLELVRRSERPDRMALLLRVGVWAARMSLFLVGDVKRASAYLHHARDVPLRTSDDAVFERDLLELVIARRAQRDHDALAVQLLDRARTGSPRHGLALSLLAPERVSPAQRAALRERIEPVCYLERLERTYTGEIFGRREQQRLQDSPELQRSAEHARELELRGAEGAQRAFELYRDLGDEVSARRVAVDRAPFDAGTLWAPMEVSRRLGPIHDQLARSQLAAAQTVERVRDGSLLEDIGRELDIHPGSDGPVLLNISPELSALPYELIPVFGGRLGTRLPCLRTRSRPRHSQRHGQPIQSFAVLASEEETWLSSVVTELYAREGVKVDRRELHSLGRGQQHDAVHLVARLVQQGPSVLLMGLGWTTISLAKVLDSTRLLVLHIPDESSAYSAAHTLLLRNNLAAELYELSQLEVLVTAGPLAEPIVPDLVRSIVAVARGQLAPANLGMELARAREASLQSDPDLVPLPGTAVFCDEPRGFSAPLGRSP